MQATLQVTVRQVGFMSDGLRLAGILRSPAGAGTAPGPAIVMLHGFGGTKDAPTHKLEAETYASMGYIVLQFDFRGCGASEGARGRILCQDAVADAKNAITWLAEQPEVDPERIALTGQSYGAAVAIYTAGIDQRVAAVVSINGWGDGLSKFRGQHKTDQEWAKFTAMLDVGRARRAAGEPMMVPRMDIVPIPPHLRANLPPTAIMEFPVEVAHSMADFRPKEVVGYIAPRPLLLVHAANDSVTPTEQSIELMQHAGPGAELMLLGGMDHFAFAEEGSRLRAILRGWLDEYFPLTVPVK